MKKRIEIFSAMVCIMLVLVCTVYAGAADLRYIAIRTLESTLSISSGTATCVADVTLSTANHTSILTATLKRSSNGSNWIAIKSWSKTGTGFLGATIDESVAVAVGYKYKLFVTAVIKNANGIVIETANKNSSVVEY